MKRIGIIGGETHIGEVTQLSGESLQIVAAAVRQDQAEWAKETFNCDVVEDYRKMLESHSLDIVAVANENDLKARCILDAIDAGCDVIVDKPLSITLDDHKKIEAALNKKPDRRLLNLLTLRGNPPWVALGQQLKQGKIGTPAFTHIRMAVRLKRQQRPPWFLDSRRSGGLFLDLLIHGLDQVEWLTGQRIVALTANMGNLGFPDDENLRDHAAVYCEMENGSSAVVEGQRMLPDTKGSDYRVLVAGSEGYAQMVSNPPSLMVTNPDGADVVMEDLPEKTSVVDNWLKGLDLVPQEASLRANRLAVLATVSAEKHQRIVIE